MTRRVWLPPMQTGRRFAPAARDDISYSSLTTTSTSCANGNGDRMNDGGDDDAIEPVRPTKSL